MNERKQNEACAALEFGERFKYATYDHYCGGRCIITSTEGQVVSKDYNSLDALHRIVCGLDEDTFKRYGRELRNIIFPNDEVVTFEMLKATPSQVREALLKATSRWEAKEGGE